MPDTVFPSANLKKIINRYIFTILIVFFVLMLLGGLMRFNQSSQIVSPTFFYAMMTLHGLGMAGTLFIGGFIAIWYLLSRYLEPKLGVLKFVYILVLLGTTGLIIATLIGQFAAGWYTLYPLPFIAEWPSWATGTSIISLMILGTAWLVGQLELLRVLTKKYGLKNVLGWQYFGHSENRVEVPPAFIITTVALIAAVVATVSGAVIFMLYFFKWVEPSLHFDALLLKNIAFLFGHTLVNITMYLGIAVVYELMPTFTHRPWKSNAVVAVAWNSSLLLVMFAFLHHLYMDFAQPLALQYIGQIASYFSAIPATVVTVFGSLMQVYRSGLKWSVVPMAFYFGIMGWVLGGIAALVDSTILANFHFHNTMWVPAHFHTYFLMGFVFILFGFFYYVREPQSEKLAKWSLYNMLIGGYGFVVMFYIAGALGVPRRYATYDQIPIHSLVLAGKSTAAISVCFLVFYLVGLLMCCYLTLRRSQRDASS